MIVKTKFNASRKLLDRAVKEYSKFDNLKTSLNKPTGDFFYDPWVIKDEFQNTVWSSILKSLPVEQGEARVIILKNGTNYQSHADIDDRYHLNIQATQSYLIDLDREEMFKTVPDLIWYEMDTSSIHTAANFGEIDRVQIVVRKLLKRHYIKNFVSISIIPEGVLPRYHFDNIISPFLNKLVKSKSLTNFRYANNKVTFDLDNSRVSEFKNIIPKEFIFTVNSI
jgi:hypothetical protein